MSRNRRNKRNPKIRINSDDSNNKNFNITAIIFIAIIFLCLSIILVRNYNNKLEVARQKEILDMQIKAIFEDKKEEEKQENVNAEKQEEIIVKNDTIVKVAVTGGILCNSPMLEDAKENDTYNFSHMFEEIEHIVKNSDLAIGTMETNFIENEKFAEYSKCNSPKEFARDVKNSGISLVSMAHNHALDYGYNGLKTTKDYLESIGFSTVGVTTNENNSRFIVKNIKGIKIAFLSYTYGVNGQSGKSKEELKYVNLYSKEQALEDLKNAKEQANYIFVIMHWGDINSNKVSKDQEEIGKILIENGADVILGAHPSVVEPMEIVQDKAGKNKFIAYSMGNYCSYLGYEYSPLEIILNIQVRKDGKTGEVTLDKVTYTPIYMLDNGKNKEDRFTLVDIKDIARRYAYENSDIITKNQYNTLIKGLEKIESVVRSRSKN